MSYEHHKQCTNGKVSREYRAFRNAIARCSDPEHPSWKWYGERGIKVKFATFGEFLAAIGGACPRGWCLDRIDYNKGYEAGNVRWVRRKVSSQNKRPRRDKYGVRVSWVKQIAKHADRLNPAELLWLAEYLAEKWCGVSYEDVRKALHPEPRSEAHDAEIVQAPTA